MNLIARGACPAPTRQHLAYIAKSDATQDGNITLDAWMALFKILIELEELSVGDEVSPTFLKGSSVSLRAGFSQIANAGPNGFLLSRNFRFATGVSFGTPGSMAIQMPGSPLGQYIYTDSSAGDITIYDPASLEGAFHTIKNLSGSAVAVTCPDMPASAFLNSNMTPANTISIPSGESVSILSAYVLDEGDGDASWVVMARG